ncbi:hypothetical protein ACN47E_001188 [Coniothyrium glycines]
MSEEEEYAMSSGDTRYDRWFCEWQEVRKTCDSGDRHGLWQSPNTQRKDRPPTMRRKHAQDTLGLGFFRIVFSPLPH